MKIIDISVKVPEVPVYPGDPETKLLSVSSIKNGAVYNLTEVTMSAHAGTHADAPLHFIDGGSSIDSLSPSQFCGEARVVTIYKKEGNIEKEDLIPLNLRKGERILFRTRNSVDGHIKDKEFYMDFCALSPSAAQYLADSGAVLAGIDYASIGVGDSVAETHRILLSAGVVVLEWLDLEKVCDGAYFLSAAPIKIAAEGAPARALLFEKD